MCNHDCFNCPYPDCVVDEMTEAELLESSKRDAELRIAGKKTPQAVLDASRRWREANKERFKESQRRYRERNKEKLLAYKREYYRKNRDVILAKQRKKKKPAADGQDRQAD